MFGRKKQKPPAFQQDTESQNSFQPRLAPRSPSEAIKPMATPPLPPHIPRRRGGKAAVVIGLLTRLIALAIAAIFGFSGAIDALAQGKATLHSLAIQEGPPPGMTLARLYENEILSGDLAETPR